MKFLNQLKTEAVLVPGEFIDTFMASANGDFVKVYLCLLQNGNAGIEEIAEKLMLTEGDVKRAVRYWQEKSVLSQKTEASGSRAGEKTVSEKQKSVLREEEKIPGEKEPAERTAACPVEEENRSLREKYSGTGCTKILNRLSEDPEFKELLLIAQKYLSKILNEKETQVFAYLYDGLHLSPDVLDYLVAYAVDHDHASIRYIEKLGTDWAEVGVRDVKAARRRVKQFEEGKGAGKGSRTAAKAAAEAEHMGSRTDYNELVMQELLQNMGD